jgi:hypothetical protein
MADGQRYYDSAWSQGSAVGGQQKQGYKQSSSYEVKEHYERKSRRKGEGRGLERVQEYEQRVLLQYPQKIKVKN